MNRLVSALGVAVLTLVGVACAAPSPPATSGLAPPATGPPPPSSTSSAATPGTEPPTTPSTVSPSSTVPPTTLAPLQSLAYADPVFADFPIVLVPRADQALLAERDGRIFRFSDGAVGDEIGDITDRVTAGGEQGLLGMAVHPDDPGRLFVHYTDLAGDTTVSEFALGETVDVDSERVLLSVDQPASNHNGGMIQFGPDGALYLGLGDGGGGGDPFGNGQNLETLLGGIVRIDVDGGGSELWHYGLRNPWRFWIEGEDIWIADVGQGSYEEVNLASIVDRGLNFGWPITEGGHCFATENCDTDGLAMPLIEIERGDGGTCSITGGVVYRGSDIPELDGRFLFSDYCGGYLRSVGRDGEVVDHTGDVGAESDVVSFGVDEEGEVYVLTARGLRRLTAVR